MTHQAAVRLNEEQHAAIGPWCVKHSIPIIALLREAGLAKAGIKKFDPIKEASVTLGSTMVHPVKLTEAHHGALTKYCATKLGGMPTGTFLREAALEHIGRSDLGVAGRFGTIKRQANAFGA